MKVTKIEIFNYKSIKNPIEINFFDTLPTVLIGKNGSGKTNILEALETVAESNINYYGSNKELLPDYKVHIQLSNNDISLLFPGEDLDIDQCRITAYCGERHKIDKIESGYLIPKLHNEILEVRTLANELKKSLDTYKKQLEKISYNDSTEVPIRGFLINNFNNSTTNFETLERITKSIIDSAYKLADELLNNFISTENTFKFTPVYNYYLILDDAHKLLFRLNYVQPDLAPFERDFISINETAIKREITKINNATKKICDKITILIKTIDEHITRLKEALTVDYETYNIGNNNFYNLLHEIQKCIGSKCFFLRNENRDIIFKDPEEPYDLRNDKSFIIFETYINKIYNGDNREDLLKQMKHSHKLKLTETDLNNFEHYLNSTLPGFEAGMYDFSVEQSNESIPQILLHEKGGDAVPLNLTNTGRRWYFTYYFMKSALQPGDLFIIDEPAATLYPLAQKELLNELFELKKSGIKVIYSTHSPYLIPPDWQSVHFVSMESNGTTVTSIKTPEDHFNHIKQLTGDDIFNLQELIEKYNSCGSEQAANNCYKALIKKYGSEEEAAKAVNYSVDTLVSWKKKKRGTTFENVIKVAGKTGVPISELL